MPVRFNLQDRRTRFAFGIALLGFILLTDQVSKWWIVDVVRLHERPPIEITSFFYLTFVQNHGVSFGLLRADSGFQVWGLTIMAAIIAGVFLWWMRSSERALTTAALALVVGGALGNMIDRVRFGGVVDFLDFSGLMFPWVFNIADASITIGAALLVLDYFANGEHKSKEAKPG